MAMVARTCSHPKMRDELQSPSLLDPASTSCSHPKMRDELQLATASAVRRLPVATRKCGMSYSDSHWLPSPGDPVATRKCGMSYSA